MTSAQERTQKLLILAGDQDISLQARDFDKMITVIVKQYLSAPKQVYVQFAIEMLTGVIRRVPLKYHMYAGLTTEIRKVNSQLAIDIIKNVVSNIQNDLNNLKEHQSINGLLYLSELMNLNLLNSMRFYDIIDDIMMFIENTKNANHRQFFILIFSRILHNFSYSLSKKSSFQFKKLLERAKKYCNKNTQFNVLFQAQQKGTLNDGSLIMRLYPQQNPSAAQDQIQDQFKLKIQVNNQLIYVPIEYYFHKLDESEKLYEQFQKNEGWTHLTNVEQIIELMKQNGTFMIQKINNYLKYQGQKTSFIQRYVIDMILGKGLKSKNTIIESYILVKLVQLNKVYAELVESALAKGLNFDNESYDLGCQTNFAQILSYVVVNWPAGKDDMTDISRWDWEKFMQGKTEPLQDTKNQAKKNVLLKIICHKLQLLSKDYRFSAQLKKYAPKQDLKTPTKYKSVEQLQKLQNFQGLVKSKAPSQQILPNIQSQTDYEIFLQALFQKTSQSHTHLQVLANRYENVFKASKQDYDWTLLNTIRSYWSRSLFHRLLYLQFLIEKGFIDYVSYVKYIAKVETSNEEQAQWIKIELNELHKLFASKLQK